MAELSPRTDARWLRRWWRTSRRKRSGHPVFFIQVAHEVLVCTLHGFLFFVSRTRRQRQQANFCWIRFERRSKKVMLLHRIKRGGGWAKEVLRVFINLLFVSETWTWFVIILCQTNTWPLPRWWKGHFFFLG